MNAKPASMIWHWRRRMFGPPWFRRFMWHWDSYWSDNPFVWWSDVQDLYERLTTAEQQLEDMTSDYHRWHDAYLQLKYPGMGQRVASNPPPCKICDGTGFAIDAEVKQP